MTPLWLQASVAGCRWVYRALKMRLPELAGTRRHEMDQIRLTSDATGRNPRIERAIGAHGVRALEFGGN
jgi:hypothetical protein